MESNPKSNLFYELRCSICGKLISEHEEKQVIDSVLCESCSNEYIEYCCNDDSDYEDPDLYYMGVPAEEEV